MASSLVRRRWIRGIAIVACLYVSLWVVTMIFGPEAIRRQEQWKQDGYEAMDGLPPSTRLVWTSMWVPAPFLVEARWSTYALKPDRGGEVFLRSDESRTLWFFGWTRIVLMRNVVIS